MDQDIYRTKCSRAAVLLAAMKKTLDLILHAPHDGTGIGDVNTISERDMEAAAQYLSELGMSADAVRLSEVHAIFAESYRHMSGVSFFAGLEEEEARDNVGHGYPSTGEMAERRKWAWEGLVDASNRMLKVVDDLLAALGPNVEGEKEPGTESHGASGDGDAKEAKQTAPTARPVDESATLSARDLAERFRVELAPLRKRLERLRRQNHNAFIETADDRMAKECKYLYRVAAVRPIIQAMKAKASATASAKRPPGKNPP